MTLEHLLNYATLFVWVHKSFVKPLGPDMFQNCQILREYNSVYTICKFKPPSGFWNSFSQSITETFVQ